MHILHINWRWPLIKPVGTVE